MIILFIVERDLISKKLIFDKIFTENSTQLEIFENTTKNIIDNAILGYNGTILVRSNWLRKDLYNLK